MLSTTESSHVFDDDELRTIIEDKLKAMSDALLAGNRRYCAGQKPEPDRPVGSSNNTLARPSAKPYRQKYHRPSKGPINGPTKSLVRRPSDYPTLNRRPADHPVKGPISCPLSSYRRRTVGSAELPMDGKPDRKRQIKDAYKVTAEEPEPDDHNTGWYINWMTRRKETMYANRIVLEKILKARPKVSTFR